MTPFAIPNLPTDNLYKFYAMSGIFVCIFAVTTVLVVSTRIKDDLAVLKEKNAVLKLEAEFLRTDVDVLELKREHLEKSLDSYNSIEKDSLTPYERLDKKIYHLQNDPEWRAYLEFVYTYEDKIIPERRKQKELMELQNRIDTVKRNFLLKSERAEVNLEKINASISNLKSIITVCSFLFVLGLYLAIKGFRLWRKNVQDVLDKKNLLELELLSMELEERKKSTSQE